MDIATVSNTDQKVNDKKYVPKNVSSQQFCVMSATQKFCLQNHWNEVSWNFFFIGEKFNYCHVLKAQLFSAQG